MILEQEVKSDAGNRIQWFRWFRNALDHMDMHRIEHGCDSPWCLILLDHVHNVGKCQDMLQCESLACTDDVNHCSCVEAAHKCIYEKNYAVNSRVVENLLHEDSLVPTAVSPCSLLPMVVLLIALIYFQNAFLNKPAQFGFVLFSMLVVDLMHKFELGVWKAIFIHLLHILDCQNESLKHELDNR